MGREVPASVRRSPRQPRARATADSLRPLDPELAAVVVTRATEALVHGLCRDEPEWLAHPAFLDGVTQLVVGYLAPGVPPDGAPSGERA